MLRYKRNCRQFLGACALVAASIPMTAEAQYPGARCPSCVDGVCIPRRETMGYNPTIWRRWPGAAEASTGPTEGGPRPLPGPVVPDSRREAQPGQAPPRRSIPPEEEPTEEMPSSEMAPEGDPLQDLPVGPDLGDGAYWQGSGYAPYGPPAQGMPIQGSVTYAPQYAAPQYATPQYAPAAYAPATYVPAQAAPTQAAPAQAQYAPQYVPATSAPAQYPVQPSAYVPPSGPSGVQSAGYEMPVAPVAAPANYPVQQATYATQPAASTYPGLPPLPVEAAPVSLAPPENNPLRNRSRY